MEIHLSAHSWHPDAIAIAADARDVLHRLLDSLNPEDRIVITLLHLEEKSVNEIAEITGWTRVMVKVRAFRARQKLKKTLQRWENGQDAPAAGEDA